MISMRKSDVCLQMQLTQPTRPLASVVRVALGPIAVREKGRLHAGGSDVLSAMLRLNWRSFGPTSFGLRRWTACIVLGLKPLGAKTGMPRCQ
jgi:hypothetical protein